MDTFILRFWSTIFSIFGNLSLFSTVGRIFPRTRTSYGFVDIWVIANLILSIVAALLTRQWPTSVALAAVLVYGLVRVFEIIIYQINVLLFDEYKASIKGQEYKIQGPRRLVILMMHNYVEVIMWYSAIYLYCNDLMKWEEWAKPELSYALYGSFFTMSTFGASVFSPKSVYGIIILSSQSVIGLFMTILMIARFIAVFPRPESHEPIG
jgi:hypothetical protein